MYIYMLARYNKDLELGVNEKIIDLNFSDFSYFGLCRVGCSGLTCTHIGLISPALLKAVPHPYAWG